jgi:glycosyltransferase involved in cell wall biosynthesis
LKLPFVSTIIPTLLPERFETLCKAVCSVLDQTYPHVEVIVVADGPQATHVEKLSEKFPSKRLRIVHQDKQKGPGASRNAGARVSQGDYLAFLDDDDEWLPRKLEVQMEQIAKHPHAALVFSDAHVVKDGAPSTLFVGNMLEGPPTLEKLCAWDFIPCLTVLIKREVFSTLGGFDPSPEVAGLDDWDLWLKVWRSHSAVFSPRPLAVHFRHKGNYSQTLAFRKKRRRFLKKQTRLFADRPACGDALRRALQEEGREYGFFYHRKAYECLCAEKPRDARPSLRFAITCRPFHLKNYVYWFFTYLPPSLYAAARSLKKKALTWQSLS